MSLSLATESSMAEWILCAGVLVLTLPAWRRGRRSWEGTIVDRLARGFTEHALPAEHEREKIQ
jgi:hypothetical protein